MSRKLFTFAAIFLSTLLFAEFSQAAVAKGKAGKKNEEVVLTSDGGMEWDSNKKTFTAEKKALAVRGDTALGADRMTAFYREVAGKSNEFFRVTAKGNVIITTPKQVIYADRADYEIEKSVIILKGNPVKLIAGDERMTSKELELWQDKNMAVAKKSVVAQKDARRLESETVKAFFAKKGAKNDIERFEAEDGVKITNGKETVTGDSGVYYVASERAVLTGNVKIEQGGNYILGEVADINMKTGVSRLQTPASAEREKGKVRGVFLPEKKRKSNKVESNPAPLPKETVSPKKKDEEHNDSASNEKLLGTSDAA